MAADYARKRTKSHYTKTGCVYELGKDLETEIKNNTNAVPRLGSSTGAGEALLTCKVSILSEKIAHVKV